MPTPHETRDSDQVRSAFMTLTAGLSPAHDRARLLSNPAEAEVVGQALADVIRDRQVDTIASWESPENGVLAHVIARRLTATSVCATEVAGILEFTSGLRTGARVALVSDAFRTENELRGLLGLVNARGSEVVAVAALMTTPVLRAYAADGGTVETVDG
ncbi:hypothetical protein [Nonomuraea sp. NPDC050691]|uniref:hypothetical protein n=1 Tax=Nonomuraea sp. NPDC050691 TaxID=3155661 RepID=UPI00341020FA